MITLGWFSCFSRSRNKRDEKLKKNYGFTTELSRDILLLKFAINKEIERARKRERARERESERARERERES